MNPASSPEFRQILRDLTDEGYHGKRSGDFLREAWKRYRKTYGHIRGSKRRKCPGCGRLYAPGETKHFHNPGSRYHLAQATKAHLKAKRAPNKEERDHDIGQFEAHLESAKASRKMGMNPKKNPIAIYNPPKSSTPLPMAVIEIRYKRIGGEHSGNLFKHRFSHRPRVYGLPDGSILIKGDKRLWGTV